MARSLKQHFTDWCRQQGEREYNYGNTTGCALCEFLGAEGYAKEPRAGGDYWRDGITGEEHQLDRQLMCALVEEPHTFAALADRIAA